MERIGKQDLEYLLAQSSGGPCISVFMPTQRGREKSKENSIRFKNLLGDAEQLLTGRNLSSAERKEILEPLKNIAGDSHFWSNQLEGIVFYSAKDFSHHYQLPFAPQELALVRGSFHFKPLFRLFNSYNQFNVLALSQKNARLLSCTSVTAEDLGLDPLVEKYREEIGEELIEKHLQFHTGTPGADGDRSAVFHGHGGEIDSIEREKLLNYFRFIDREVLNLVEDSKAPLVIAAVDYLVPLYREISRYPQIAEAVIKGNPDNRSDQELQEKAWPVVSPHFKLKEDELKALYHEYKGTGKTSNNIIEIVPAADHGRVSELFVTPGIQQWGHYDHTSGQVQLSDSNTVSDEDLIDIAAAKTFLSNGSVYALEEDQMPDDNPVAAIFRW